MKKKDLIKMLERFDDYADIRFESPTGDYLSTTLASEIERAERRLVTLDSQRSQDKIVDDVYDDNGNAIYDSEVFEVIVLS